MQLSDEKIAPQLPPSYRYKTEPYNHQIAAHNFCINKNFFALFMEQGTGKTKTIIDLANDMFLKGDINAVLVVAPNGVHRRWALKQLPLHSALPFSAMVFKSTLAKSQKTLLLKWVPEKKEELKWLMVNIDAFSHQTYIALFKQYLTTNKVFLVIDEATSIKNPTATRTIALLSWLGEAQYRGKRLVSYKPFSVKRAILTGTPVTNSVYDLWSMFYFLKPNFFDRTYFAFKAHFGIEAQLEIFINGSSRRITKPASRKELLQVHESLARGEHFLAIAEKMHIRPEDVMYLKSHPECEVPYKNLAELKQSIAPYAFFAHKKDCYDLPPKTYEKVVVALTKEQRRLYDDLKEEYITQFYDSEVTVSQKVALYTRLSQIAGGFLPYEDESGYKEVRPTDKTNPKLQAVLSKLDEASFPLIVTTRFRAEAQMLYTEISKARDDLRVELVLGGVKDRDTIMDDAEKGLVDVLVANEKIISKGYNLQEGDTIYRYSYSYSVEDNEQLEDRIQRDGQKSDKCLYVHFIAQDTLDEEIYVAVKNGKKLLDYMRDSSVKDFLTVKDAEVTEEFKEDRDE